MFFVSIANASGQMSFWKRTDVLELQETRQKQTRSAHLGFGQFVDKTDMCDGVPFLDQYLLKMINLSTRDVNSLFGGTSTDGNQGDDTDFRTLRLLSHC